jgi:hypothetical protein
MRKRMRSVVAALALTTATIAGTAVVGSEVADAHGPHVNPCDGHAEGLVLGQYPTDLYSVPGGYDFYWDQGWLWVYDRGWPVQVYWPHWCGV